ncbi:MAG TPA: hypothetical protein VF484_05060 [Candidatus Limnocylindrales bacterium]
MAFVAPKVILTPLLIASTTLAGRRWGALLSGWLIALPLTSGPICLFITLEGGPTAGVAAATGALVGAGAEVAFSLGYLFAGADARWTRALATASLAYVAATTVLSIVLPSNPPLLFVLDLASFAAGLAVLRSRRSDAPLTVVRPGRWDIPARALVATILVLTISGVAPIVGGHAAGILATYPVYVSVLTSFAHRVAGRSQALAVVRGLLLGMPGFATFFLTVATTLPTWPVVAAFAAAVAGALGVNLAILLVSLRLGEARRRANAA